MTDGSRGYLLNNSHNHQFADSRSMHVPVSATAAAGSRNAHSSPSTPFQDGAKRPVGAGNGTGSLDNSQSSDYSRLRNSHSPSVLGSGSQTSLTTNEGVSESLAAENAASAPHKLFDISMRPSTSIAQKSPVEHEDDGATGDFTRNGPQSPYSSEVTGNGMVVDTPPISYSAASDAQIDGASSLSHFKMGSRLRDGSVSGQKRTAAGDIKASSEEAEHHDPNLSATWRNRSRSIGSATHGNRIAELSVHLRTRLSYAAAKVEKGWRDEQSQIPFRLRHSDSPTPTPSNTNPPWPESHMQGDDASEPTTISATNSSTTFHSHTPNEQLQKSPATRPSITSPNSSHRHMNITSPTKLYPTPKLEPPVDIISSAGSGRRRRPNPNETTGHSRYSPYPGHRRYHSQQEFGVTKTANSHLHLIPGTPPLRPSMHTSTPFSSYNGLSRTRTHSQSTLMEQDAIETLLFMSSPKNSGYHPSPQPRQNTFAKRPRAPVAVNSNTSESQNQISQTDGANGVSPPSSRLPSRAFGLEAHAGDEIDRMLDQMDDSDSDDGRDFPSNHNSQRSTTSQLANSSQRQNGSWRPPGV